MFKPTKTKRSSKRSMSQVSLGGQRVTRGGVRHSVFYGIVGLLLAGNAALGLALSMSGDLERLTGQSAERAALAYEMRIADLRTEIDRLHSRVYVRDGDMNLQLRDLVQTQEEITEQQQFLRALNRMASDLGLTAVSSGGAPMPLPAPARGAAVPDTEASLELPDITEDLEAISRENRYAMTSLAEAARAARETVAGQLEKIGMPVPAIAGVGGPFEPAREEADTESLTSAANAVALELRRFAMARDLARSAPVHTPIAGAIRLSSGFGNRKDPFTGRTGFHSGLDFAATTGTRVLAVGSGEVLFAGKKGGYGNLIEIDHGYGLVSRYGHLSAISVTQGETIESGDLIGLVGSTGRSTGPHLHLEIRRSDSPLNPRAFMSAGKALEQFL